MTSAQLTKEALNFGVSEQALKTMSEMVLSRLKDWGIENPDQNDIIAAVIDARKSYRKMTVDALTHFSQFSNSVLWAVGESQ